jgi:hypothetical protein
MEIEENGNVNAGANKGNESNSVNSRLENIEIVNNDNKFKNSEKITEFDKKEIRVEKNEIEKTGSENNVNHNIEKLNIEITDTKKNSENVVSVVSVSQISPITDFAIILEPIVPVPAPVPVRTSEEIEADFIRENKIMPSFCKIIDIESPWTDTEELRKYMIENCITSKSWKRRQKCVNLLCNDDALVQKGSLGKILVDICTSIYLQV